MDRAINKATRDLVTAFEVYKNGSYQNLTKGEWIAPKDSIHNWEEISDEDSYVHYRKETLVKYKSGKEGLRRPHFAVYPNSKAKTVLESPEHKMLKDWLFNRLKEDDLEIIYSRPTKKYKYDNSNKLSELNINWNNYSVEVPIRSIKNLKADILLPFKKNHPILGFGIIIEIQLSNQNIEITWDRTWDRAICGYSTIWLFKKDFNIEEDNIELKNNKLKIFSFSSELKYGGKRFMKELKYGVEEQCRFLDSKKNELIKKVKEIEDYKEEFLEDIKKRINNFFSYKIKELSENFNEEIVERVQENFFEHHKYKIEEIIEKNLPSFLTEELINNSLKIASSKINYEDLNNRLLNQVKDKINLFNLYKYVASNPPNCPDCNWKVKFVEKRNGEYAYVCENCGKWINIPKKIQIVIDKDREIYDA